MTRWAEALDRPTLIVGDFNVAPLECDVYDHKALLKVVSHTPIEVETLERFRQAHGWVDLGRRRIITQKRKYSRWPYSSYWQQQHQVTRFDHICASPAPPGKEGRN